MIHSIRWKAGAIVAMVFSIALLISGVGLTGVVEHNLKAQAIQSAETAADLAVKQIDERLGYMQQAFYSVTFDPSMESWLIQPGRGALKSGLPAKLETLLMTSNYNVFSVFVNDLRSGEVYSTELQGWADADAWDMFADRSAMEKPRLMRQNSLPFGSPKMISLVGQMRKNYFDEPLALISVNVLVYFFDEILSQNILYDDTAVFLVDAQDNLLAQGGVNVSEETVRTALAAESGTVVTLDEKDYIVMAAQTDNYRLRYRQLIPEREVFADVYQMRLVMAGILLAFSAVVFVLLYKMLHYVTNPIYELSDTIRSYRRRDGGNWEGSFQTGRKDEFAYLYQSLDEMTRRIDQLIDEDYKAQLYKKETQLRIYRNGINPHFLYNILDSILWTIKFQDYQKAEKMLQDFSLFLHHVLHESKELIGIPPLREELESFCRLSSFLRDDTIAWSVTFSSEMVPYEIPSFLVQPLVENCFKHAFKGREQGAVEIWGAVEGEEMRFVVKDNGIGMSGEQRQELLDYLHRYDFNRDKEHFGIASVHQRLKLYYGAAYGVEISSDPQKGTQVSIRLPLAALHRTDG